jgi:hypothetical protein
MRRVFGDGLISIGAIAALLTILVAVDDRVRERFSGQFAAAPTAHLAGAGSHVREVASVVFDAARDQSIEHAPLMIFVLAATVLVLFMVRM